MPTKKTSAKKTPERVKAFYIGPADGQILRHAGQKLTSGAWVKARETYGRPWLKRPLLCSFGMHASVNVLDASMFRGFAPGVYVCRVEVEGPLARSSDKIAGMRRRTLSWVQLTTEQSEKLRTVGSALQGVSFRLRERVVRELLVSFGLVL